MLRKTRSHHHYSWSMIDTQKPCFPSSQVSLQIQKISIFLTGGSILSIFPTTQASCHRNSSSKATGVEPWYLCLQLEKTAFEVEAKQRAQDSLNRYGEQEVCKYSGVIINSEESRLRDHKAGKNYRCRLQSPLSSRTNYACHTASL